MKKSIFFALLFIGLGFQQIHSAENSEKLPVAEQNKSILEKIRSNDVVKTSFKIAHDLAILYATHMITCTAHEYGHALLNYYLNNAQAHIVINVNDQTNENEILNTVKEKLVKNGGVATFPSLHVNFKPSSGSVTIPSDWDVSSNRDVTSVLAGPLFGMAAGFLIKYLSPKPYYLKNINNSYIIWNALNLLPCKGLDGYRIFNSLGVNTAKYISEKSLSKIAAILELCNIANLIVRPLISVGVKAFVKAIDGCM